MTKEIVKKQETMPALEGDPEKVLNFARKAATALTGIIQQKKHKVIINKEQYLEFEDWQTIARFYGTTVGIEWTKPRFQEGTTNNIILGYEAKAIVYKNGQIISSAEASCLRNETNWKTKPEFQLKSMVQTRAMAKALRNVFAWVVVLAGFKPTPAEEMNEEYANGNNELITEAQTKYLFKLAKEKLGIKNKEELKKYLKIKSISQLTKQEASKLIDSIVKGNQLSPDKSDEQTEQAEQKEPKVLPKDVSF